MISIKPGVDLTGLSGELAAAIPIVAAVFLEEFKSDCVITSGRDGKHRHITHYLGYALDFRTRHLLATDRCRVEGLVQKALGGAEGQYDVILEDGPDHLHVELDPR